MADLIDRQQAIDALEAVKTVKAENGELYIAKINAQMKLETLPSAQPDCKTGHWILDRSGGYCCNRCMEPCATYVMMKPRDKFCKVCGSRNEVME